MDAIINAVLSNVVDIVIAVLGIVVSYYLVPLIKKELVPFLTEKRIYEFVVKFVTAVEKMAESGAIEKVDKKEKVVELLESKGIAVTDEVEALIEAAVKELDIVTSTLVETVKTGETE